MLHANIFMLSPRSKPPEAKQSQALEVLVWGQLVSCVRKVHWPLCRVLEDLWLQGFMHCTAATCCVDKQVLMGSPLHRFWTELNSWGLRCLILNTFWEAVGSGFDRVLHGDYSMHLCFKYSQWFFEWHWGQPLHWPLVSASAKIVWMCFI